MEWKEFLTNGSQIVIAVMTIFLFICFVNWVTNDGPSELCKKFKSDKESQIFSLAPIVIPIVVLFGLIPKIGVIIVLCKLSLKMITG